MVRRALLTGWILLIIFFLGGVASAQTPAQVNALATARRTFNLSQYDQAIAAALQAQAAPQLAPQASVVLGRAFIERFYVKSDSADLALAHNVLSGVDVNRLTANDRRDLTIGLGLTVFFEGLPGAAAELLEVAMAVPNAETPGAPNGALNAPNGALNLDARAREKLFDWWATAVDRAAQLAPDSARHKYYERIVSQSERELARDPASMAAGYWLAAGARGAAELDRAWHAAIAAWIRAKSRPDQATSRAANDARADLDLLVTAAIIPERARALDPHASAALIAAMRSEWEQIKNSW